MPLRIHLLSFSLSARVMLALGFLATLLGVTLLHPPDASAAARSVKVNIYNDGDLRLGLVQWKLDHGVWKSGYGPPAVIEPHSNVILESESDGVATGTEGWVKYLPEGAEKTNLAYFYWDNPYAHLPGEDDTFDATAPNGCTVKHDSPDGDNITVTFKFACESTAGDAIADLWKLNGYYHYPDGKTTNAPKIVDLPGLGAQVNEKEIFVQLDWMADATITQKLDPAAIKKVAEAFAAQGIRLYVDQGFDSVLDFNTGEIWGNRSQARSITYKASLGTTTPKAGGGFNYDWTEFRTIRDSNSGPVIDNFKDGGRAPIFHYALAAHNMGTVTNGGLGDIGGPNFIISLGSFGDVGTPTEGVGTVDEQAGTLMHELGHNLGLLHGGDDETNNKPNYLSIMNYSFAMSGLIKGGTEGHMDYSHGKQRNLDEFHLDETTGLGPNASGFGTKRYCPAALRFVAVNDASTKVDWDCDGKPDNADLMRDVNNDGDFSTTHDYDDWRSLNFASWVRGSDGATEPPAIQPMIQEVTPEMLETMGQLDTTPPVTTATPDNPANGNGWNNTTVTVTLSATDDISGVATTEYNLDGSGWQTYSAPIVIDAEGTHTLLFHSIDLATNQEDDKSLTLKIDKTLPTIPTPVDGQRYIIGTPLSFTCDDELSGIESCSAALSRLGKPVTTVGDGNTLPTASPGYFTVTPLDIHDLADNYVTAPVHYTVAYDVTPLAGYTSTVKSGYWARLVVALRDANKTNLSKRTLKASSLRLERLDAGNNAVQKLDFAYQFQFGAVGRDDGYELQINSRNLALGTWRLVFTTSDAPDVELTTVFNVVK